MKLLGFEKTQLLVIGGMNTAMEIASQPELWSSIYQHAVKNKKVISSYVNKLLPEVDRIVLTGAGTSAFIGLSLQGTFSRIWQVHTDAVPATDIVTNPDNYFLKHEKILLISFSRSGDSPESIAAITLAENICKKCSHLIITCDEMGQLSNYNSDSEKLILHLPPEANDKSLAMTGSYSGMLLYGLLIAYLNEIDLLQPQITLLKQYGYSIINQYALRLRELASMEFQRAVFLGSGTYFGTATEAQLKLQELTDGSIICKNDSYLGFRHGPKAVTDENTLLVFFLSNNPYIQKYEKDLVLSMNKGKTPFYTLAIYESLYSALHFNMEIRLNGSDYMLNNEFLAVCYILPVQLLGFYKSIALGLKPDNPSESGAISRVVENVVIYNY